MKDKKLLVITGILSFGLFLFVAVINSVSASTANDLQPALSANTYTNLTATKSLTVGTEKNKGKLYVKGAISNPIKKKPVLVKDNLKVTGDLEVKGEIKGAGIIKNENIGLGAITGDKIAASTVRNDNINFGYKGFIKAGGMVNADCTVGGPAFNNLGGEMSVKCDQLGIHILTIPGMQSGDRLIITAANSNPSLFGVIEHEGEATIYAIDRATGQATYPGSYNFLLF